MTQRTPTLAEVIRAGVTYALESVHTSIPGRVVKYDKAKQRADIEPLVKVAYEDEEGNRKLATLPIVTSCPVQFPTGGGLVLMFPIVVGDTGLLMFSESSMDKWLTGAGDPVDPVFDHRHHLADGVFIPGVKPFGAARATDPGSAICIGTDGGDFQGAALGEDLDTWLTVVLKPWLLGMAAAISPTYTTPFPTKPTFASDTVKITP